MADGSLSDSIRESWEEEDKEREMARPANDHYTGNPCGVCGRARVYLRKDGQLQCEKCETIFPAPPEIPVSEERTDK